MGRILPDLSIDPVGDDLADRLLEVRAVEDLSCILVERLVGAATCA